MIGSELKTTVKITVKHDGEMLDVNEQTIIAAIRGGISDAFTDEDDGVVAEISVYVSKFEYGDNADSMRARAHNIIDSVDPETLADIINTLKEF